MKISAVENRQAGFSRQLLTRRRALWGLLGLLLCWIPAGTAVGGKDPMLARDLTQLSLEELLDVEVEVASVVPTVRRNAPGIVSVITREEIENSGARDLIDVLRQVPGFEFGVDIFGTVGLGFRGIWGHEGKILLLWDGHEFNESMYGNLAFGNHFPVDQIERIEIIRGPGSVLLGAYAELAVINIVTDIGSEKKGGKAAVTSGFMAGTYARQDLSVWAGQNLAPDFYLGGALFHGYGHRSDRTYTTVNGASYDMSRVNELNPTSLQFNTRYRDFYLNFMLDAYHTRYRDSFVDLAPSEMENDFNSYLLNTRYEWSFQEKWKFTPQFRFKVQQSWRNTGVPPDDPVHYDPTAYHYDGIVKLDGDPTDWLHVMSGGEFTCDRAEYDQRQSIYYREPVGLRSYALFGEGTANSDWVNVTAGVRFDDHNKFGRSAVPRLALTKKFGPWHGKFLYSRAFRSPAIEQYNRGINLRKEETQAIEAEAGYQYGESLFVTANFYDLRIHDPVVYSYDPSVGDTYRNEATLGTRGAEMELRIKQGRWTSTMSYSYYQAVRRSTVYFQVPQDRDLFLAFPAHKITASGSVRLWKELTANPSLVYTSRRYANDGYDAATEDYLIDRFKPEVVVNLYFLYRNLAAKGLDIGLGVFDLFGANHRFLQPYKGGHAQLPGPSREYLIKVVYTW